MTLAWTSGLRTGRRTVGRIVRAGGAWFGRGIMGRVGVLCLGLCGLAILVPAARGQAQDGLFGSRRHFTEPTGEAIYAHVCAGCHMPDGRGAAGAGAYPSLAEDPKLEAAGYPIQIVLHGRGAMPPFQRLLSDEQVAAVVTYVRQKFGNDYRDAPSAGDVQAAR